MPKWMAKFQCEMGNDLRMRASALERDDSLLVDVDENWGGLGEKMSALELLAHCLACHLHVSYSERDHPGQRLKS